jgi:SNF2 family DNA or RNA helicase
VRFLCAQGNCLLGDDQGTGKTLQAIVAAESTQHHQNVLVVCPNTLKGVWAQEHAKWTAHPDTPVAVIEAGSRAQQQDAFTGGWVVVNYEALRAEAVFRKERVPRTLKMRQVLDGAATRARFYWNRRWDWVILDEAHRLKGRDTQTYQAVQALQARRLLCLTGTPLQNEPGELWTLLHLLDPGRYSSYWRFFGLYVDYTEDPFYGRREIHGVRNEHLLRREIAPIVLRRTKAEVLPYLPPKTYQTVPVGMTPTQRKAYREMHREMYLTLSSGDELEARSVVAQILRLRQLLSTPANFDLPDRSGKLDAAVELIQDAPGKVVVFTLFRRTVACLGARLQRAKIPHAELLGGMSTAEVEAAKAALNTGEARVLVATLGAGGVGHTLTGASTVLFVDQHWNPAMQEQAVDRLHRIGQEEPVRVLNLVVPGTVDDLVEATLLRKLAMVRVVLGRPLVEELLATLAPP